MEKMKSIQENKKFHSHFYEPIFHDTFDKILVQKKKESNKRRGVNVEGNEMFFIKYLGVKTMNYVK